MAIRLFHWNKPESLNAYEQWEPVTAETFPFYAGSYAAELERGNEPGWLTSYEGLVVAEREQNMYHDSYFYVTYFDPETGGFESKEWGATAYPTYGHVKVDAPPALMEYYADVKRESYERYAAMVAAEEAEKEARTPSRGKTVTAARTFKSKGTSYAEGTEFEVFWYGESDYGHRVGLEPVEGGERLFTAAHNVKVVSLPEGEAVVIG